jgi:hypothetical protein
VDYGIVCLSNLRNDILENRFHEGMPSYLVPANKNKHELEDADEDGRKLKKTKTSNECGPRTLFALLVMGLHPAPNDSILIPFMSSNLAQILCTWLASSIISGQVHISQLIQSSSLEPEPQCQSTPYDIIQWHLDEHDPQAPKDPKKTEALRRSNEPLLIEVNCTQSRIQSISYNKAYIVQTI